MFSASLIALLIAAVPGLAPFAVLLEVTFAVITAVKLAMDTKDIMQAIEAEAPHLLPVLQKLADQSGAEVRTVAAAMFAPHLMTNAERDYWTDLLNKNRNL